MTQPNEAPSRIAWPPLVTIAAIGLGLGLTIVWPLPWIGEPLSDLLFAIGGLLGAAGVLLVVLALRAMWKAETTVMPTRASDHLVTSGPFAISRNPIYLGEAMLTIAIGLVVGSAWFILTAILAAMAITRLAILREEKVLAARFGKRYRDYAHRVRRWM